MISNEILIKLILSRSSEDNELGICYLKSKYPKLEDWLDKLCEITWDSLRYWVYFDGVYTNSTKPHIFTLNRIYIKSKWLTWH